MKSAGFDTVGLELSPWVVHFARNCINVPVPQEPLENLDIGQGSVIAICMFAEIKELIGIVK
jgi:hypothetical protein